MKLKAYLDTLARQFPSSQWEVREGEGFEAAVLNLWPFQVKVVLFTSDLKQFQSGDVTLTLHAGPHLLKMYGTPTFTLDGKISNRSKNTEQFERAAHDLCNDLLSSATAILAVTETPVP